MPCYYSIHQRSDIVWMTVRISKTSLYSFGSGLNSFQRTKWCICKELNISVLMASWINEGTSNQHIILSLKSEADVYALPKKYLKYSLTKKRPGSE